MSLFNRVLTEAKTDDKDELAGFKKDKDKDNGKEKAPKKGKKPFPDDKEKPEKNGNGNGKGKAPKADKKAPKGNGGNGNGNGDEEQPESLSATEPVGPARTSDDCKKDHATAIGQADQHAKEEQGHRAEADTQQKSMEQFADEYEQAGGQVSNINGQRHLHPPTVDDSPEVHDLYTQFDDALTKRDDSHIAAIEAHRNKKDQRGQARRHDYEAQTGEKWREDDHPPGHGHQHVDPDKINGNGKGNGKAKKNGNGNGKYKKEDLDDVLVSLDVLNG